jgi:hypothetical protein
MTTMRLVDPTGGEMAAPVFVPAPRPARLRGLRLGLLNNSKSGSEAILRGLAAILDAEFAWRDVVHLTKHSASLPPAPGLMDELRARADLVITGVGD